MPHEVSSQIVTPFSILKDPSSIVNVEAVTEFVLLKNNLNCILTASNSNKTSRMGIPLTAVFSSCMFKGRLGLQVLFCRLAHTQNRCDSTGMPNSFESSTCQQHIMKKKKTVLANTKDNKQDKYSDFDITVMKCISYKCNCFYSSPQCGCQKLSIGVNWCPAVIDHDLGLVNSLYPLTFAKSGCAQVLQDTHLTMPLAVR